jgi:hypothetical protein
MRKTTTFACIAAAGVLAAPGALADCRTDIEAAEKAATEATDAQMKSEAQSHIEMAKSELAKANEQACSQHAAAAQASLEKKPTMTKP